ncbi:protein-L-isoaspartate(D-aspartate) O-methyltransferase [bacterium]|nr:protein-L-isoaspartate(D-aspartate) O-methyltransferase [bacterium]
MTYSFHSSIFFAIIAALLLIYQFFSTPKASVENELELIEGRQEMVRHLKTEYRFSDESILKAMSKVQRHRFIPADYQASCDPYGDHPCPIGNGQTISQPFIVAYMTERIRPQIGEKILEIGTGSGYQAAILAELGAKVFSIEIIPELANHASKVLKDEGYSQVKILQGDGYKGWPKEAPFDAVIVTCAPEEVPKALVDQLKEGGRMIIPIGIGLQRLVILRKILGNIKIEEDLAVRFVPMVHGEKE